ncbi:cyclic GMP-AMP synthase [Stegastes partitus]|uniref:Cyclic GMP-AMP synthase n=1 Tax=Stegastes partitus TaxID=144197 RepID=A0A3B4ZJP4_9TELE|nr:PREDICTED: cyclic GMP-AMP synthase [Stegastes partitus]
MTGRGRGRPGKAKNPDAEGAKRKIRPEEIKQVPLGRCPDDTKKKETETARKQKPKEQKAAYAEEKPSVQNAREEKKPRTPAEDTKSPARGAKAKTCAARIKPTEPSIEDTAKDSPKTKKGKKARGGKAKAQVQFAEETTETQLELAQDQTKTEKTRRAPEKTPKAKICAAEADLLKESTEMTTKMQLQTPQGKAAVDSILKTTLKNLKIKTYDRSNASKVVNAITDDIIKHLKENTRCFQGVQQPLRTGSYYENLKISNPDEFDVMVPFLVERVHIEPFGADGAFYSVELKRGNNPLRKFQKNSILSASEMLQEFREEVKKCVKKSKEWRVTRKKAGCPAVTLTTEVQSVVISLDIVLCLQVKSSWPSFTTEGFKVERWLGAKVRRDYRLKHYYLVPKYEGRGNVENEDGVLAKDIWRVSFSHVEKAILKNHGSDKTCCEQEGASCCRKDSLKLLKHLLSLLKESNPSLGKFCSYHAKTTLFHACCSRTKDSEWKASDLSHCFHLLLQDFEGHLEKAELPNFFIPSQNLLSGPGKKKCKILADCIKEERLKGFPIFEQQLRKCLD